jgi:hypothetical protein
MGDEDHHGGLGNRPSGLVLLAVPVVCATLGAAVGMGLLRIGAWVMATDASELAYRMVGAASFMICLVTVGAILVGAGPGRR